MANANIPVSITRKSGLHTAEADSPPKPEQRFFGDCSISSGRLLSTPAGECQLTCIQTALLIALIEAGSSAVKTDELLDVVWGEGCGTPQNLANAIHKLRHALRSSSSVDIQSVYGTGYRLRVTPPLQPSNKSGAIADALCLEAEHRLQLRGAQALHAANALYKQASSMCPSHAPAATGRARVNFQLLADGFQAPSTGWHAVFDSIRDFQHSNPPCAEAIAFRGLGECAFYWDFETAESTLNKALDIDPTSSLVHVLAGRALLFQGLHRRAIEHFYTSLRINPADSSTRGQLAYALSAIGDIDAAKGLLDYQLQMDPANPILRTYETYLEAAYGDPEKACELVSDKLEYKPTSASTMAIEAFALARAGNTSDALATLRFIPETYSVPPEGAALSCLAWVALGDHEAALLALKAAAQARDFPLGMMLHDPTISPLQVTPAFASLMDEFSRGQRLSTT